MKVIEQPAAMGQACRNAAKPLVLVATMGALHEGHVALIREARKIAGPNGTVVASIFLNPKQFNSAQDLKLYPQPFEADKTICEEAGVDLLFHPSIEDIYLAHHSVDVEERQLSQVLCGRLRPGHFKGVATVLTKMFNIITPNKAIFGEKDWQQLAIVRCLVRDLNFPIEIIGHPTVRADDGLALSSRNARLSEVERKEASKIYQVLQQTVEQVRRGEKKIVALLAAARASLEEIPGSTIDYIEIRNEETLESLLEITKSAKPRLFVAVKFGETRLIDNMHL